MANDLIFFAVATVVAPTTVADDGLEVRPPRVRQFGWPPDWGRWSAR